MKLHREWAMPNKETFTIKPIKDLIERYVWTDSWADPFAGWNSPAHHTNDLNPEAPTDDHMDALEWMTDICPHNLDGFLFDPPYSPRQVSESYKKFGFPVSMESTQARFWSDVKSVGANRLKSGGYAICFGWNSGGMGLNRGFEMVEILLVAHGGAHNDTIITVEQKH